MIYNPQVSTVYEGCKSPEMIVASIVRDEEIIEIDIVRCILRPPRIEWKISICQKCILQYYNMVQYSITDLLDKDQGLYNWDPCRTECIPGELVVEFIVKN